MADTTLVMKDLHLAESSLPRRNIPHSQTVSNVWYCLQLSTGSGGKDIATNTSVTSTTNIILSRHPKAFVFSPLINHIQQGRHTFVLIAMQQLDG